MSGYIGVQPVPQATQRREYFTATNGQTTFNTNGYTPNYIDVYMNGVKLSPADFTASNGSDVVLASGATTGDLVQVVSFTPFNVANQTFIGDVNLSSGAYKIGGNTVIDSSREGTLQRLNVTAATGLSSLAVTTNAFTIGSTNGYNMAFDPNEIQARNNGAANDLTLQKNGGSVGIQTTAPATMLQVGDAGGTSTSRQRSIRLSHQTGESSEYGGIEFYRAHQNSQKIGAAIIHQRPGTSLDDSNLLFKTSTANQNATTKMTLTHGGMLGVGGDTPRGSYTDLLLQDTTDNAQMEFKGTNTSFAISHFDNGRLGIYSNVSGTWNEARGISINAATGNVGVGTTDGDEKLHVNGSLLVDAFNTGHEEGIFFRDGFSNSNKYNISILAYDHGSADAGQSTTSPDGLSINGYDSISFNVGSNNRNEVMRIKGGTSNVGNVGIGIQNPPKALTVFRANQTDDTTVALLKLHAQFADSSIEQTDKVAIQFAVQNSGGGIQTSDAIKFSYNNNLYLMEDGGDVAIGNVSDPSARLDISAASSTAFGAQALKVRDGSHTTIQMDSGAADGRIQVGAAGTLRGVYKAQHAGTQTDHPFSLIQDNSSRLTIRDDRSVAHIDSGYRFDLGFFPAPSNTYQHFKTDCQKSNHMLFFEYKGYSYSSGGAVLTAMTVYAYTGTSGPYDPLYTRYGHNTANGFVNCYYSSDGYLVLVLKTNHTNGYTGGWMWAQSGNNFTDSNIRMLAQTSTSSNSGAY